MRVLHVPGGGTATIVEIDGAHVVLQSSVPSPPGSLFTATPDGAALPVRVKVRGCKRLPEGATAFRIEGRFVDLTNEQRAFVTELPDPRKT